MTTPLAPTTRTNGRPINVGVDAWDHRPVAEATLVELVDGIVGTPAV